MLVVVSIDLTAADLAAFDRYESKALALLVAQGGTVLHRIRSLDRTQETHILQFPNEDIFTHFMACDDRAALHPDWLACGAKAALYIGIDLPTPRRA